MTEASTRYLRNVRMSALWHTSTQAGSSFGKCKALQRRFYNFRILGTIFGGWCACDNVRFRATQGLDRAPETCIFTSIPAESVLGGSEALRNTIGVT